MPLTFIDIERKKSWRIGIFFLILLFMYLCTTIVLVFGIFPLFSIRFLKSGSILSLDNLSYILMLIALSIIIASIHFYFSAFGAVRSVMKALDALPPDPDDGIHMRLLNVMAEIHIVTGNKRKMDCMVIPSLSMNALAVADLKGESAVAITEGLLSRLTRPQLEAVMSHEAYHILSGDCIESTVAASLFGMYASATEKIQSFSEGRIFLSPAFIFAWILLKLSQILNMFISREREYRADAGSVRMTRNPLAMAGALHLLSRNWRGIGFIGPGLENLCIVNPRITELDESEGWWADLMSTHPPIMKRIDILSGMARVSISELDRRLATKRELSDMTTLHEPFSKLVTELVCTRCHQPIFNISYENTHVYKCDSCDGILVEDARISRIIARRETPCTDRVTSLARAVIHDNQMALATHTLRNPERKRIPLIDCPKCKKPMLRTFYSLAYLIEIDRCFHCGLAWFDRDELEMLQCLIENRITA